MLLSAVIPGSSAIIGVPASNRRCCAWSSSSRNRASTCPYSSVSRRRPVITARALIRSIEERKSSISPISFFGSGTRSQASARSRLSKRNSQIVVASGCRHASFNRLCKHALALLHDHHNRRAEAEARTNLGYAHHHLGNHPEAVDNYQRVLELRRDLDDRHGQATVLVLLGDTHDAAG